MPCRKSKLTERQANSALKLISHRGRQHQKEKRKYYCEECNAWHLTSKGEWDDVKQESKTVNLKYNERWDKLTNQ